FTQDGWLFELKHDGFRALARAGTHLQLVSRWGRSMAHAFPEVVHALAALPDALIDGEFLVPTTDGRSDFEELRRRNLLQRPRMVHEAARRSPAVLIVFDLLELRGDDVRNLPLAERRHALYQHIPPAPGIQLIDHIE